MGLSLEDIKGEFREGYQRTGEVLTGMDAYIMKLEKRVEALEGQMASIASALYADEPDPTESAPKIYVGNR